MSLPNIFPSNPKAWTKDVKNTLKYFEANLDSNFFIFTNVNFTGQLGNRDIKREADILILNKNGLIVLEVKENLMNDNKNNFLVWCNCRGDLTCKNCDGKGKRKVTPFEQAKTGLNGIKKLIENEIPSSNIDKIQKNFGVLAWNDNRHPVMASPIVRNDHSGFFLTKNDIETNSKKLKDIINEKIKLAQWGDVGFSDFELSLTITQLSPHATERNFRIELKNLEEQYQDYDTLILEQHEESFKEGFYGVVKGTSGSGKTILAMQVAKLHANANRSVVIFFQNLNIASDVRYQLSTDGYNESISVIGLYPFLFDYVENYEIKGKNISFLAKILKKMESDNIRKHNPPNNWLVEKFGITKQAFYSELCIEAIRELGKNKNFEQIDTIIVDEAQLFTKNEILAIESLKSDNNPSVFLFGDDFQFLKYGQEKQWEIPDTVPKFQTIVRLLQNYRTSSEVTKFMNAISDCNLRPKDVPGHCKTIKTKQNEWKKNIKNQISYLIEEKKFKESEIAVLSPDRSFIYSQFKDLDQLSLEGVGLNYIYDDLSKSYINVNGILFSSIRRFTGRQKKAIILLLPDNKYLDNHEILNNYRELAFIGAGRAEHTLIVLFSPGVNNELNFSEIDFQ